MRLQFSIPPVTVKLDPDEVHVWRAALDFSESRVEVLQRVLTEDERNRAGRFYFQKDRNRFIVARSTLRTILGKYLDANPEQIRFHYGQYGKPRLAEQLQKSGLLFNLSHSHNMALAAVTCHREIGVDLELIRSGLADEQIAERFFSPREVHALRALPKSMQDEAFFNCWTRKEAYIKARGEGLSVPLHMFDVSLLPDEPARLLSVRGEPNELLRWRLGELSPAAGFVGAVAVEGHDWRLRCWEWTDPAS
jgi:4'-phosphopantetheinyl transferase